MLKPAILYSEEIKRGFMEKFYTKEMRWYMGSPFINEFTDPSSCVDNRIQWAILSDKEPDKVIGYMTYYVDLNVSRVERFGLMSFDPGNPIVGKEVFNKLTELISKYHSVSWRAVGDNHTLHNYINFCKKMNGDYFKLTDALVDENGNWVDDYIFEIINPEIKKR